MEDIKEILRAYRMKAQELEYENERLECIRQSMIPSSPVLDDMPHGSGVNNTAMIDKLARIEELEAHIIDLGEWLKNQRAELESLIDNALRSSEQRTVIRLRYFDLMSWQDVSAFVYGGEIDFVYRKLDYLESTHALHYRALNAMRRYLSQAA